MDIYIDKEPFESDAVTLSAAIEAARARVLEVGRLIVEVRLDGRTLGETEMNQLAEQPEPGAELQLLTADPVVLCVEALRDVRDRLAAARQAQQAAAEYLQTDRTDAAMDEVRSALTAWQECHQAVGQTTELLNIPLDKLTVDDRPAADLVQELADQLNVARDHLASSDWVGLADVLGHDLDVAAGQWDKLLDAMIDHLQRDPQDERS